MSVLRPQGGYVPSAEGNGYANPSYPASINVRIYNSSVSAVTYTWWIADNQTGAVFERGSMSIAAGANVDVEQNLKLAAATTIQHAAGTANALLYNISGVLDDGS